MSIVAAAAIVATVVFAAGAVLQLLVAAGKPYGRLVWGGGHRVLPVKLRIGSVVAVVLYAAFTLVLLDHSGLLPVFGEGASSVVATWALFAFFAIGIVMNAISPFSSQEARGFSPGRNGFGGPAARSAAVSVRVVVLRVALVRSCVLAWRV